MVRKLMIDAETLRRRGNAEKTLELCSPRLSQRLGVSASKDFAVPR